MKTLALIDYGSGNLHSARKALVRAAAETGVDIEIDVTADPDHVLAADRILLPGVGAFGACMAALSARDGLIDALREAVLDRHRPFLGICVGMQLLAQYGEEYGRTEGLGWIDGHVAPLIAALPLHLPHMGWNRVDATDHPLLPPSDDAYFVHSYAMQLRDPTDIIATATHGSTFTAAVARGNIAGVQFHPEKSQRYGLALLGRFLQWEPV